MTISSTTTTVMEEDTLPALTANKARAIMMSRMFPIFSPLHAKTRATDTPSSFAVAITTPTPTTRTTRTAVTTTTTKATRTAMTTATTTSMATIRLPVIATTMPLVALRKIPRPSVISP